MKDINRTLLKLLIFFLFFYLVTTMSACRNVLTPPKRPDLYFNKLEPEDQTHLVYGFTTFECYADFNVIPPLYWSSLDVTNSNGEFQQNITHRADEANGPLNTTRLSQGYWNFPNHYYKHDYSGNLLKNGIPYAEGDAFARAVFEVNVINNPWGKAFLEDSSSITKLRAKSSDFESTND